MIQRVVFIGHDNYGAREIFSRMKIENPSVEFLVVITTGLYYRRSFLGSVVKLLREASFRFCLARYLEGMSYKLKRDTLARRARKLGIRTLVSRDVNSDDTRRHIARFQPDVIYSSFTMHLLKKPLIELSPLGTIGCHPSILPHYRGLEVFFWALANGERTSGCSVFRLTERIDAGQVLLQEPFEIAEDESVDSIYRKLTDVCARLMSKSLQMLVAGERFTIIPSDGEGSYYPMPTRAAYKSFVKRGGRWR